MAFDPVTLGAAVQLAKDPATIKASVEDWLDDHPEATTTVEDGSITKAKLHDDLADEIEQNTDAVGVLKSAFNGTTLCKNLIGMEAGVYYPVYIPAAQRVHLSSKNASVSAKYNALNFYDASKTLVDTINISPGAISRTNHYDDGDIYFAKWDSKSDVDCQLEYGTAATDYVEYFPNTRMVQQNLEVETEQINVIITTNQDRLANTTLCKNLIGMDAGVYYPVYIPAEQCVHLESKNGAATAKYNAIYLYDANKTLVDTLNIAPGVISKTNHYDDGDIYFAKWDAPSDVECQLEYGTTATAYQEYFPNLLLTQERLSEAVATLPVYYSAYLPGKISKILTNVAASGEMGDNFFFVTDLHWPSNAKQSPALMRKIDDACGIGKVINGGDYYNSHSGKADAYKSMLAYEKAMDDMRLFYQMYAITGNHEWNNPSATTGAAQQLTQGEVYSFMYQRFRAFNLQPQFAIDRFGVPLLAYYVDDEYKKRRYYFIPCNYGSNIDVEVKIWFCRNLKTIPDGYSVVVFSHVCTDSTALAFNSTFDEIADALDALKAKGSFDYYGMNDYSNVDATPLYCVTGHTHKDGFAITDGGIICTATTTDACGQSDSGRTGAGGTVNEQAFEVATDDGDGLLSYVRIGGGVNRKWHYNATEVTTTATLTPTLTGILTWASSDTSVATVSDGTVTKAAAGAALVYATDANGDMEFWAILCE